MKDVVSVIVPIYKVECFLYQCVKTILQQSYENLEIILIDDGSPDNCGKMCDEFATQDCRIKVIHKPNGGLSDARNAGIDIATGSYITFIDSDDCIMPDMIESLMSIISNENADIAQCVYIRWQGDCVGDLQYRLSLGNKYIVYSENKMSAYIKEKAIATAACGKIYKKSLFNEIRFPVGRLHEDVFTTYRLIHEASSVAVTDYVGYLYRINDNSITTSKFSPGKLDSVYGEIERAKFIEKNYPNLCKQAYSEIIYACNQCLIQMAKSRFNGNDGLMFLKNQYKKYGKFYIMDDVSFLGKFVVLFSMINIHFAKLMLVLMCKIKLMK